MCLFVEDSGYRGADLWCVRIEIHVLQLLSASLGMCCSLPCYHWIGIQFPSLSMQSLYLIFWVILDCAEQILGSPDTEVFTEF